MNLNVWQNVFGKLEMVGFIIWLQCLHSMHFIGMEVKVVMDNPAVDCGIPNCKEACPVDFCGPWENASWSFLSVLVQIITRILKLL
jgi:hypothetical protein